MAAISTVTTAISIALPLLRMSYKEIEAINKKCSDKGLPPAFAINLPGGTDNSIDFDVQGNPDYRFEGFGIVVVPLNIQFWIHYKPDSPEHVELGRHLIPIKLIQHAFNLPKALR